MSANSSYATRNRERFDSVLFSAREVQDFLWGEERTDYTDNLWIQILLKRIRCLERLDLSQPHVGIERRKRVLQLAAVSLAWLEHLDRVG